MIQHVKIRKKFTRHLYTNTLKINRKIVKIRKLLINMFKHKNSIEILTLISKQEITHFFSSCMHQENPSHINM